MSRPSNWYVMDSDQQRAWERAERERDDLEYEHRRAIEDAESAARNNQRKLQAKAAELVNARMEQSSLVQEIEELTSEVALAHQWLKDNGHWAAFKDWASSRRDS